MKAGLIGLVDGEIDSIESFSRTTENRGYELREALEIRQTFTDLSGDLIGHSGRAAVQRVVENEDVEIGSEGDITVGETPEVTTLYSEFLIVPNEFVAVGSGSGSFVFDLIGSYTDTTVQEAEINLKSYSQTRPEANPWKIGFYGKQGNAENGVVHGDGLLDDDDLGEILIDTATNQLGLEFEKDGVVFKVFITESGYVEVYQPSNLDSAEYLNFVSSEVMPHAKSSD